MPKFKGGLAVNAHGYERFTKDLDLVIGLERENILRGLRALLSIGYQLRIPVTPEQFADPSLREQWRRDKNMVVLQLWSDTHRRTPINIFVYEPFDFAKELPRALRLPVGGDEIAPIVTLETLLELKKSAGRSQDFDRHRKTAQIGIVPEESMTQEELYAHPGWETCTFEGAELSTLLLGLKTTFREKLEWLEEAETLALQMQKQK